jgi:hypothetical protein
MEPRQASWSRSLCLHGRYDVESANLILLGSKFDGTWENDRINGEGTSWYPNGNRYQGDWSNGRINGRGSLTSLSCPN